MSRTPEERAGAKRIVEAMERQASVERLGRRLFGPDWRAEWENPPEDKHPLASDEGQS